MEEQGGFGDGVEELDPTAALDNFPELWTEILKRVPQADSRLMPAKHRTLLRAGKRKGFFNQNSLVHEEKLPPPRKAWLRHVPLASRRFSNACWDPHLWPELHVLHSAFSTEARWQSFLRWLAVRAPRLQTFEVSDGGVQSNYTNVAGWERWATELAMLLGGTGPQLWRLIYIYPDNAPDNPTSALPVQLGRLSQLTSLDLGFGWISVSTAQVEAVLQTLPSLQHLRLDAVNSLSDGLPASITSCTKLTHLAVIGGQIGAVSPGLGCLTRLAQLKLENAGVTSLPGSISRLAALRVLDLAGNEGPSLPFGLTACQQLSRLDMELDYRSPVLARLHSLRCLHVSAKPGTPAHETFWTQLTAITELHLCCHPDHELDDHELDGQLIGQSLEVPVTASLSGMTCLRKLNIYHAMLHDLPPGPYLSRLESLAFGQCVFLSRQVPVGLAAASQLRHLDLTSREREIKLTPADVAVLTSLPALATLIVAKPYNLGEDVWDARVAQFQAECIAQGQAPPAIFEEGGIQRGLSGPTVG